MPSIGGCQDRLVVAEGGICQWKAMITKRRHGQARYVHYTRPQARRHRIKSDDTRQSGVQDTEEALISLNGGFRGRRQTYI